MLTGLPWWLLQRGSCKVQFVGREDDRAINSAAEGVCVPAHLAPPGSPQAKLLCHLHAQLSWGRVATGKKSLASTRIGPLQSFPTLCDPIDGSPPGSAVPGILQARTLEWVAISFSNA